MKKVARLRMPQLEENREENNINLNTPGVGVNKISTKAMASEGGVRTTGRIKKPKHFFDPSDYDVPRPFRANNNTHVTAQSSNDRFSSGSASSSINSDQKKHSRSPSASPATAEIVDVCSVCSKRDAKRGIHAKNKLVHCQNCDKKIHRLCLPTDFEDVDVLMKNYRCMNCRKCAACNNMPVNGHEAVKDLITCAKCVKSYHMQCHSPPVLKFQQFIRNWRCSKCIGPKIAEINEIIGTENKVSQSNTMNKINNVAEKNMKIQTESNAMGKATLREINKRSAEMNIQPLQYQPKAPQQQMQTMPREKQYIQQHQQVALHKPSYIPNQQKFVDKSQTKQIVNASVHHQPITLENDVKYVKNSNIARTGMSYVITNGQTNEKRTATGSNSDVVPAKKEKIDPSKMSIIIDEPSNLTTTSSNYCSTDAIDIPTDVKYWSVEKVFEYFSKYFPIEAHVFRDQEIDGMSLLLLKRSDVVKKLPIKLGPSLRLYNLILKIQAQVNDPTLGWNVGQ